MNEKGLKRGEWLVRNADFREAQAFIVAHHYARGGSNTFVYCHGLFPADDPTRLMGVAWWLPPTRVACESVNKENWTKVLSLTRLAIHPDVPKNACTFLLARSVRLIRAEGRFTDLVTYADESQGHNGGVYRAANWRYSGRTGPYPRWVDANGKQTAPKATVNRTKSEMEALGCVMTGRHYKHKFTLRLSA